MIHEQQYDSSHTTEPDVGAIAKERLSERRSSIARRIARRTLLSITVLVMFILIFTGWGMWSLWEDRVYGDEILYGTCFVDLGDVRVTGKRRFIRPYMDAFGMRMINPNDLQEELIIHNENYGLIVVSMQDTGESNVTIMKPEMGPLVTVPLGEKYLFTYKDESDVLTHQDLCF